MISNLATWHQMRLLVVAAGTGLLLGGCASTPPPTAALDAAHLAITNAERAEAGQFAAAQLAEARDRLGFADKAVADNRMIAAERLANESRTEAELASATTAMVKAQAVNGEMQRSNGTLNEELQRSTGAHP